MKRYQLFVGDEWIDPASGEWFGSSEPFSGISWAGIARGNAEDAARAVEAAHRAFVSPAWRGMTATQRGALLRRLAQLIEAVKAAKIGDPSKMETPAEERLDHHAAQPRRPFRAGLSLR